ncbi:MAG: tetratricopeptide repeat protein [Leptolyngbya sp. SIO4C1]|nr:tetratricopeptide repeat protein [Leptolyngbya sp. SIO4C1]
MPDRPALSVCMIVKNEAEALPRCLGSVQGVAALETVVVDTGSTDGTPQIAATLGAKMIAFDWADDFAAARNASLAAATGDWILVIDADETLTAAGRTYLQQLLAECSAAGSAASLLLVTWLRQELNARQAPYTQVARLFRNHPAIQFEQPYHETVDRSVEAVIAAEPSWQIAQTDIVAMTHTGYTPAAIAAQHKFERAQRLLEQALAQSPQAALYNKLGALYGEQGDWAKSLSLLEQGLSQPECDPITYAELCHHAGMACRHLNQPARALAYYQRALASSVLPQLKLGTYINLGSLLKQQGQLEAAIDAFTAALCIDDSLPVVHYNLGVAQRARGQLAAAIAAYQKAIELDPSYAEAYQNLGVSQFKLGRLPQSAVAFQTAIALYQQQGNQIAASKLRQGLQQLGVQ